MPDIIECALVCVFSLLLVLAVVNRKFRLQLHAINYLFQIRFISPFSIFKGEIIPGVTH
jgi:hypothetical protein